MTNLEYIGKNKSTRNPAVLEAEVQRRHPRLTKTGILQVMRGMLFQMHNRINSEVITMLGDDICMEDVTAIAAWDDLEGDWKTALQKLSVEARRDHPMRTVGLSRTYVWRKRTGWVQQVADHDLAIIRQSPVRHWFRDVDRFGPFVPQRAFDYHAVRAPVALDSAADLDRFRREQRRVPQWTGR